MTLKDIFLYSRSLTDRPPDEYIRKPIVERGAYANATAAPLESCIMDLERRFKEETGEPFMVVNTKNCIIRPTILNTRTTALLYAVDKRFVVNGTEWFGYTNFNLNPPTIYYGDWMDVYAKRFVIAKEYLGLYAGQYGVKNPTKAGDIIDMARAASESIITKPGIDLTAEQATFYMAIETLIPHKLRMQYDWLKRNNATLHQIALAFMVPDEIVEHYQSATYDKTSTFAGLSKMINENLLESDIKKLTPPKWFIPQF